MGHIFVVPKASVTERALFPASQVILTPAIMTRKANDKARSSNDEDLPERPKRSMSLVKLFVMFIKVPRSERLISSSGLILVASNVSVHTMVPALPHICLKDLFQIA